MRLAFGCDLFDIENVISIIIILVLLSSSSAFVFRTEPIDIAIKLCYVFWHPNKHNKYAGMMGLSTGNPSNQPDNSLGALRWDIRGCPWIALMNETITSRLYWATAPEAA